MNQFNLGQFITKFIDYSMSGIRGNSTESTPKAPQQAAQENFSQNLMQKTPTQQTPTIIVNTLSFQAMPLQNMQMNHVASLDSALYTKELMNLPKNMQDLMTYLQKNLAPDAQMPALLTTGINLSQISLLLQQNGK